LREICACARQLRLAARHLQHRKTPENKAFVSALALKRNVRKDSVGADLALGYISATSTPHQREQK
jgi:hypothetical protein